MPGLPPVRRSPESIDDAAVLLPERFRAVCAFGAGRPVLPPEARPVSPAGQIETGILRLAVRGAKRAGKNDKIRSFWTPGTAIPGWSVVKQIVIVSYSVTSPPREFRVAYT